MNVAARQVNLQVGHVAEFHSDVDRIRDDRKVAAVAQAARDPGGSRAGGQADRLVFLDEFGSGEADMPLLGYIALLASLEGSVIAEGLVEEFLHKIRAAMRAPDQAFRFQA